MAGKLASLDRAMSFRAPSKAKTSFHFPSSPFHGVDTGTGLTPLQVAQLQHRLNQPSHRSFVGNLIHGSSLALHPIEWSLDKIMRPVYAVASGADEVVHDPKLHGKFGHFDANLHDQLRALGDFGHGAKKGITGRRKITFSKVLKDQGLLKHHKVLRGFAGFGMDVALDPTMYLTGGISTVAKLPAEKIGLKVLQDTTRLNKLSRVEAGAHATEMGGYAKALTEAGSGFEHRAALAKLKNAAFRKHAFGAPITAADHATLNTARSLASEEFRQTAARRFELGYRVPGSFGTKAAKLTLPVKAPRMAEVADAHIPVLSKVVEGTGKRFVPGYRHDIMHAALMQRKHQGEELAGKYLADVREAFHGLRLSAKEQRAALHFFERPGGVVKHGDNYILNPKRIEEARKAGLSEKQIEFAQAMHRVSEGLYAAHRQHGVKFTHLGEKGQLYVPHILAKGGKPLEQRYRSMLTERGFRKNRANEFSVAQLHAMKKAGNLPENIETDPFKLLAMHVRQAANEHADETLLQYVAKHLGVPARAADEPAFEAAAKRTTEIQTALAKAGGDKQRALKGIVAIHKLLAVQAHEKAQGNHTLLLVKHSFRKDRTSAATMTRIANRAQQTSTAHEAEMKAIEGGQHEGVKRASADLETIHAKQVTELKTELAKVGKVQAKAAKGTRNDVSRLVEVPALKDVYGHTLHFEPHVAEGIAKLERVITGDDKALEEFAHGYRKWLGKWKIAVTSVNPGYGVRNTLSDVWNMWLSGVPAPAMALYGAKAAHLLRLAKHGDPQALATLRDTYHHGVLSGLFQGDVQTISNMLEHSGSKRALLIRKDPRVVAAYSKITQDLNRNRENWGRLTHYLYRREAHGENITDAARFVRAAHFDYEDLTPFEQRVMKSVAPFYTWTRKNVPFQVKALLGSPGRFSAFPKLATESQQAAGGKDGIVPDYLSSGMAFKVPGGKYFNTNVGWTDLAKLDPHQARETFAQLVTPVASVPFELATNKNLFTGQDIKGTHPRNPVNDRLAKLLTLIPGSNVGPTERGGVKGTGANPKLTFMLGQIPALQALINNSGKIKGQQNPGHAKALAYLTGIALQSNNQDTQKQLALLHDKDSFARYVRGLRDSGLLAEPKKRKKSKHQQLLDETLFKSLGRG